MNNLTKSIIFTLLAVLVLNKVNSDTLKGPIKTFESNFIKIDKVFKRITACVEYAKDRRAFSPTTVRTLTFNPSDASFISKWVQNEAAYPFINLRNNYSQLLKPHTRKNNTITRRSLFTFITLVVTFNSSDFDQIQQELKTTVDPRRDFLIFITGGEAIYNLRKLKGLREKMLLDVNSDDEGVWVEPIFYNGDMIYVKRFQDIQIANPMGANLRGRNIWASAPETPPFNYKADVDAEGKVIIVEGSLCKIFTEAAKTFNYTYFIGYEGYDYGKLHPNGTWTGSYSKIHYPDSGYDIDLITSSELLWNQCDVGSIATYIDMMFGVSHPITRKHWYAFLLPFDQETWSWTCIMFVFLGAVQGVVMYFMQNRRMTRLVYDSIWLTPFAMTMEQGLQDIPKGIRYLSLLLLLACTILGTGYKSTLRTHLMFPKPPSIPTTFDELADRTDYAVSLTVNGALEKHFWATSEQRAVKKIRERLTFETDWGECYKKAFLDEHRACISWVHGKAVVAKTMTLNTTIEPLVYSKDAAIRKFLSFGFQENSIYVDSFSRILATPATMGIVSKWEEDVWTKFKAMGRENMLNNTNTEIFNKLVELAAPQEDAVPLELGSLVVVLAFVPAGGLFGAIAFAWEIYSFSKENSKSESMLGSSGSKTENQNEDTSSKIVVIPNKENNDKKRDVNQIETVISQENL